LRLKILLHDNCFDGAASAALFSRFYRDAVEPGADVVYLGLHHTPGDPFPPGCFDGDVNVCVDFRYSRHPRLSWWFDHHASAFTSVADRVHYEASGGRAARRYYDPDARSCTKLVADVLTSDHGWRLGSLAELVRWADVIDGAQFADAAEATSLEPAAMRLAAWFEHSRDPAARARVTAALAEIALDDVAALPEVAAPVAQLVAVQAAGEARLAAHARLAGDVAVWDLADAPGPMPSKFLVYRLFPACRYAVGLQRVDAVLKISVGANPWAARPRTHHIASLCERYGGGGHAVVGGISFPGDELARARGVVGELVDALNAPARATTPPP
jgi:hypothetical protein